METREDNPEAQHMKKKKKKKKKKVAKQSMEEESPKTGDSRVGHVDQFSQELDHATQEHLHHSPDEDKASVVKKKKKVKKKRKDDDNGDENDDCNANSDRRAISTLADEDHVFEELNNSENGGNVIVVKKKKKKPKVKSKENASEDEEHIDVSPTGRKGKKKTKIIVAEEDDNIKRGSCDEDNEIRMMKDVSHENYDKDPTTAVENSDIIDTVKQKKPKIKKRKKKRNRTMPIESLPEEVDAAQTLPAPVFKTPTSSWTSLPPIGNNGDSSGLGNLPPLRSNKNKSKWTFSFSFSIDCILSPNSKGSLFGIRFS